MTDIVSKEKRSQMMAGIRGRDTKPELQIRSALHRLGIRFRLHDKKLPGTPDLVLAKYKAVIFVHGCFWHGHQCHLFRWPSTREEFWREKISRNITVDAELALQSLGWRVATIWECSLRGRHKKPFSELMECLVAWLQGGKPLIKIDAG